MPSSINKLWIIAAVAGVAGIAVLYLFDPASVRIYPPCVFRAITGYLCAGCGATRAAHQLLHGNIAEAIRLNAMFVAGVPLVLIGGVAEASGARLLRRPWVGWGLLCVLIAWGVLRNVFGV